MQVTKPKDLWQRGKMDKISDFIKARIDDGSYVPILKRALISRTELFS